MQNKQRSCRLHRRLLQTYRWLINTQPLDSTVPSPSHSVWLLADSLHMQLHPMQAYRVNCVCFDLFQVTTPLLIGAENRGITVYVIHLCTRFLWISIRRFWVNYKYLCSSGSSIQYFIILLSISFPRWSVSWKQEISRNDPIKTRPYKLENFRFAIVPRERHKRAFCWLKSPALLVASVSSARKSTSQRTLMNRSIYYSSLRRCNYKTILLFQLSIDEGGTSVRPLGPIVTPSTFLDTDLNYVPACRVILQRQIRARLHRMHVTCSFSFFFSEIFSNVHPKIRFV